jgi:hypothetical protein
VFLCKYDYFLLEFNYISSGTPTICKIKKHSQLTYEFIFEKLHYSKKYKNAEDEVFVFLLDIINSESFMELLFFIMTFILF